MKKRFLSVILAVSMVMSMLTAGVSASVVTEIGNCGDNLAWTLTEDGTLTISGTGDMTEFDDDTEMPWYDYESSILNAVIENGVTSIGSYAFYGCENLESITISDTVTSIGSNAFSGCTSLESVTIPDSVASISSYAFSGCTGLESVTIPESVSSIGNYAFYGCTGLESVTIPDGVTSIGSYAFSGCTALESITIPDSVTSIGNYAFSGCTGLSSVTLGDGLTSIRYGTFEYCSSLESITIPESVDSIGSYVFYGCTSLTHVNISDSVTSIGSYAFYGCDSLVSITIPDSVDSIGSYAFGACDSLTSVTIGAGVSSIGVQAFSSCPNLIRICFEGDAPEIGNFAFLNVTANAYYPEGNDTWTEDVMQDYAGDITWIAIDSDCDHSYSASSCTWTQSDSGEYSSAWIILTCSLCSDIVLAEADITEEITADPTCTEDGSATCYATAEYEGVSYTLEMETVTLSAIGHSYEETLVEPTCTENGYTLHTCTLCGDSYTTDETNALGHSYESTVTDPTCTESGYTTYTCTVCGDTYTSDETEALGHSYDDVTVNAFTTCTEDGEITYTCSRCGGSYTETIEATGHDYEAVTTEATCTEDGIITYTCSTCGDTYTEIIAAEGHDFGDPVWTWAEDYSTATATFTCRICGGTETAEAAVDATEGLDGSAVYLAAVTFEGTEYTTLTSIPASEAEDTEEEEAESEGFSLAYEACVRDKSCPIYSFTDAVATSWYHDGVHFCVENQLMVGTSSTTFEPETATTRAMIITMLYRLAGSPEVEGTSSFTDVEEGAWYEDALIWAEQEGIANGYDTGEFGVNDNVTREQIAVFFCCYARTYTDSDTTVVADLSGYPDEGEVSDWAEEELSWAVQNGLITGQGVGEETYLAPGADATRSEAATMLMRLIVNVM